MRKLFSTDEYDQIVKLRHDGFTWAEVGARLGRTEAAIYAYAKRNGSVPKRMHKSLKDRYWDYVIRDVQNPNSCWGWSRSKCKDGYGLFPVVMRKCGSCAKYSRGGLRGT
jgi:hypothetical protein